MAYKFKFFGRSLRMYFLLGSFGIWAETCRIQAADPVIRVLLTSTGYESRYHDLVEVEYKDKRIVYTAEEVKELGYRIRIPAQKDGICILSIERQNGNPVYQGSIEIVPEEEGLLVINELTLETYLKGVVPSEMPAFYESEALKAQAVCARTYAWKQIQEHRLKELEADVDDSVSFQVYGNIAAQEKTDEAVKETEGQILCQNGEPIEAYYFSTSAGVTSTDEIWGAEMISGYLKSVNCSFDKEEPWSRWSVEIPWKNLEDKAGRYLGADTVLKSISVSRRSESNAVTEIQVYAEEDCFSICNEYEVREFLSPTGCMITEKDGTQAVGGNLLPSAYFELTCNVGVCVRIEGGGYGHGVGMSQTAANRMAQQSYDYQEILDYFFKDITLENLG